MSALNEYLQLIAFSIHREMVAHGIRLWEEIIRIILREIEMVLEDLNSIYVLLTSLLIHLDTASPAADFDSYLGANPQTYPYPQPEYPQYDYTSPDYYPPSDQKPDMYVDGSNTSNLLFGSDLSQVDKDYIFDGLKRLYKKKVSVMMKIVCFLFVF